MDYLKDIKIIEVGQMLTVPFGTSQLGDLGAHVVKIERPEGEIIRNVGPEMDSISSHFASVNRNKDVITLDLKSSEGQSICRDLVTEADVLIENLKSGTMEEFNLGYDELQEYNSELIYCSVQGFREDSQYAELPAYDSIIQAMSGVMSITGEKDRYPIRCGVPIGDIAASMYLSQAVLFALYTRDVYGSGGQFIEVPMLDTLVSWLTSRSANTFVYDEPYPRRGNKHPDLVPYNLFETKDSYLIIAIGSDYLWPDFCKAIDRPDLIDMEKFKNNRRRVENEDELYDILDKEINKKKTKEWFDIMRQYGVPAGPVYDTKNMWEDQYLKNSHLRVNIENDLEDEIELIRHPVLFNGEPLPIHTPPKHVGEDTIEVLMSLGYTDSEIRDLEKKGIIK